MGAGGSTEIRDTYDGTATPQPRTLMLAKGSNSGPYRNGANTNSKSGYQQQQQTRSAGVVGAPLRLTAEQADVMQKVNARRRRAMEQEEDLRVLTRNADPESLRVLDLIQQAEALPNATKPVEKLTLLQQCYPILKKVPTERFDQLAMMVYQKEGEVYQSQGETESAKATYTNAITLAEQRVARGDKDLYMILKRYVLAMVGMARIWYEQQRDTKGFQLADANRVPTLAKDDDDDDATSSMSSLESSFSSVGSVFSINQAILKSMAPRQPRSKTGPNFARVKMHAPRVIAQSQLDTREDEFVLHSKMTRELVAAPCELLLLRCCEVVEIGHNCQSELLIPALIELASIYENLGLYSRALLLVRRCLGVLCNVYDYDHPWVIELMIRAERLNKRLEEQLQNESATKIQATWKMYKAMLELEDALGRPVRRHRWIPRKFRNTPDIDFIDDFANALPPAHDDDDEENESPSEEKRKPPLNHTPPLPSSQQYQQPEPERIDHGNGSDDEGTPYPSANPRDTPEQQEPTHTLVDPLQLVRAPVLYDPTRKEGDPTTFTTVAPNAKVLGTTQDTQTDTHVQQTPFGDVLTVRTTTVTRTITENLPVSGPEEEWPPRCPRCEAELPLLECLKCHHELPPSPRSSSTTEVDDEDFSEDEDPEASAKDGQRPAGKPNHDHQHRRRQQRPLLCPYCHREQPLRRCQHCLNNMPGNASGGGPPPIPFGCETCPTCGEGVPPTRCTYCDREQPPLPAFVETDETGALPRHCPFCYTTDVPPAETPLVCRQCHYVCPPPQPQEDKPELPPLELCPRCQEPVPLEECPQCQHELPPLGARRRKNSNTSPPECPYCERTQPQRYCPSCQHALLGGVSGAEPPVLSGCETCPQCNEVLPPAYCPYCLREQPPLPGLDDDDAYEADAEHPKSKSLHCPFCYAVRPSKPRASRRPHHGPQQRRECGRCGCPLPPLPQHQQEQLPAKSASYPAEGKKQPSQRAAENPTSESAPTPCNCVYCGKPRPAPRCPRCSRLQPTHQQQHRPSGDDSPMSPCSCPYCHAEQPALRCPACKRLQPTAVVPPLRNGHASTPPQQQQRPLSPSVTATSSVASSHNPLQCGHCHKSIPPQRCQSCKRLQPLGLQSGATSITGGPRHSPQHIPGVCPYCYTQQAPRLCPHCSLPLHDDARDPNGEQDEEDPRWGELGDAPSHTPHSQAPPQQQRYPVPEAGEGEPEEEEELQLEEQHPVDGDAIESTPGLRTTREYVIKRTHIERTYYETESDEDDDEEGDTNDKGDEELAVERGSKVKTREEVEVHTVEVLELDDDAQKWPEEGDDSSPTLGPEKRQDTEVGVMSKELSGNGEPAQKPENTKAKKNEKKSKKDKKESQSESQQLETTERVYRNVILEDGDDEEIKELLREVQELEREHEELLLANNNSNNMEEDLDVSAENAPALGNSISNNNNNALPPTPQSHKNSNSIAGTPPVLLQRMSTSGSQVISISGDDGTVVTHEVQHLKNGRRTITHTTTRRSTQEDTPATYSVSQTPRESKSPSTSLPRGGGADATTTVKPVLSSTDHVKGTLPAISRFEKRRGKAEQIKEKEVEDSI